jgi:hypothetical protein
MDRVAQADLGVYQHIPGSEDHVMDMMKEVVSALKYWSGEYGMEIDSKKLSEGYAKEARKVPGTYSKKAKEYEGFVYEEGDGEGDGRRAKEFRKILDENWGKKEKPKLLHSWEEIEKRANSGKDYSYQNLKLSLRKRINKFTSGMILSSIVIDKTDDIIHKYSGLYRP